jgi:TFIIF-interacting CTD phosphatase-like protein
MFKTSFPKLLILDLDETLIYATEEPQAYPADFSYGNLVRVQPFFGDPKDRELEYLSAYLQHLKDAANIRKVEKRFWQRRYANPTSSSGL